MPTRLVVLLQSRKSAAAGSAASTNAPAASVPPKRPPVSRAGRKLLMVRRSLIVRRSSSFPQGADFTRGLMTCQHTHHWHGRSPRSVNHNSPKIVHVGIGCTRPQKVINASEESGRIVVSKKSGGIEAYLPGAPERCVVNIGAGRVIGAAHAAVGAVGVGGQARNAGLSTKRQGKRQRVFLIWPATALAAHRHGEFAA